MANLIRNQILKHLSKFTKNLSPDKIKVSTFKGEGDLHNLELDENVLMDILDLPTWLRVTKAICNKLSIKIQWTKLKSQPIWLNLDEIIVEMETCEEPRVPVAAAGFTAASGGKYGFVERIIDGISVSINSVSVNFTAPAFNSTIQLSRIMIQSKTPFWRIAELSMTRVKDESRGEVLIFKEAEWQTMRMEANAMEGMSSVATTPLRFICQQGKCRIIIKKSLADCSIIASRLILNLDDLLWVLTDTQMKAAIVFGNSLKSIILRSTQQSKARAGEKIEKQQKTSQSTPTTPQQKKQTSSSNRGLVLKGLFEQYNLVETSYHLHTGRIDLHLCDDTAPAYQHEDNHKPEAEDGYRRKVEGGAMQVTLHKFCCDYYPYHPAGSSRAHWLRYDENMTARNAWADQLYNSFKQNVRLVEKIRNSATQTQTPPEVSQPQPKAKASSKPAAQKAPRSMRLLESCFVFRLEDYSLYRVSTATDHKRSMPKKFLTSDKKQLLLPPDMSSIHVEYTDYYFPEGHNFPVPHTNIFLKLNPLRLTVDYLTVLWMNAFALNILKAVELPPPVEGPVFHMDIKLCALMPRIILPSDKVALGQGQRPEGLQIQLSQLTVTNTHLEASESSLDKLQQNLQALTQIELKENKERDSMDEENAKTVGKGMFLDGHHGFPCKADDMKTLNPAFGAHAYKKLNPYYDKWIGTILFNEGVGGGGVPATSTDSMKREKCYDLWCVIVEQFWMEFIGTPSSRYRPLPFVESFPLTLWLTLPDSKLPADYCDDRNFQGKNRCIELSTTNTSQNNSSSQYNSDSKKDRLVDLISSSYEAATTNNHVSAVNICDSNQPNLAQQEQQQPTADMNILVNLEHKVCCEINHYQYLFLMRLIETITKTTKEMSDDSEYIMGAAVATAAASQSPTVCVSVRLQDVEIGLVCPAIRELLNTDVTPSSTESADLAAATANVAVVSNDDGTAADGNYRAGGFEDGAATTGIDSGTGIDVSRVGLGGSLLPDAEDDGIESAVEATAESILNGSDSALGISLQSDHTVMSTTHSTAELSGSHTLGSEELLSESLTEKRAPSPLITVTGSGAATMSHANNKGNLHEPLRRLDYASAETQSIASSSSSTTSSALSSANADVRKSFTSAWTSISKFSDKVTDKVKHSAAISRSLLDVSEDGIGEDWETLSTLSAASEEDEELLLQKLQGGKELPAFERPHSVSDTTSVTDDSDYRDLDNSSIHTVSSNVDATRGMVSVVVFRLSGISTVIQLKGDDVCVATQVHALQPTEYGNIQIDTFRSKFTTVLPNFPIPVRPLNVLEAMRGAFNFSGGRASQQLASTSSPKLQLHPIASLRYEVGPAAERSAPTAAERGHIALQVEELCTELSITSLTSLLDLIEDEMIPLAVPMDITVRNADITLKNDAPPTYPTSPGSVPLDLHISCAAVHRGADGVFVVTTDPSSKMPADGGSSESQASSHMAQRRIMALEQDKERLAKQLSEVTTQLEQHINTATQHAQQQPPQPEGMSAERAAALQQENNAFLTEILKLQDEVVSLKQERESLLSTITFMQEELSR